HRGGGWSATPRDDREGVEKDEESRIGRHGLHWVTRAGDFQRTFFGPCLISGHSCKRWDAACRDRAWASRKNSLARLCGFGESAKTGWHHDSCIARRGPAR